MSDPVDRIAAALLAWPPHPPMAEGTARQMARRVAAELQPDFEAVVRALVDCDARFHRRDPRYFRRMAHAALQAHGWSEVQP